MQPLTLLIKPASSLCNLRCSYCFYHSVSDNRSIKSYGLMKIETLEEIVRKSLEYAEGSCSFAFQGGEPTLTGLDFYKKLIDFQKKYNIKNLKISNSLQTNGMIIDENWVQFLAENQFLVGLSLDGIKDIHDLTRVDSRQKGSFSTVMKSVDLLNKYRVAYNILSVVTSNGARYVTKNYNFFKRQNFRYLQFIPCIDPLGEEPGGRAHALTPKRYGDFLKSLFDLWHSDYIDNYRVDIRYFSNLVQMAMGYPPESCGMSGQCAPYFVIEADGGVYPCDFYVTDQWYLGNITSVGFEALQSSPVAHSFLEMSKQVNEACAKCEWFKLCRGGCRRNRDMAENGELLLNYYCPSFKEFFRYTAARINKLAYALRNTFQGV